MVTYRLAIPTKTFVCLFAKGYIDAQHEGFDKFSTSGKELVDGEHYAATEIQEKLDNLETEKASLYELWEQRKLILEQSLELQLFYRDCQNADNQMAKQEVRGSIS